MKIRKSLVSNSSSSSFIIAFESNESDACPACGRKDPDLLEFIERCERTFNNTELDCEGIPEVIRKLDETYDTRWAIDSGNTERAKVIIDEKQKLIDDITKVSDNHPNWIFVKCYVDNYNDMLVNVIDSMQKENRLIIIREEGC